MTAQAPQVFISYQRADEPFARRVREHLSMCGLSTWMDQYDIPVGAYWPDEIDRGLRASDIVVGILSPDSVDSRNVKNEWDWAIQNGRRLVLLQVAPCLIPHRYVSINFIDAIGSGVPTALAALVQALDAGQPDGRTVDGVAVATSHVPHAVRTPRSQPAPFVVGREREMTLLRGQLERLLDGQGAFVLVGGEAGIGKTTLMHWLVTEAEARDAIVLTGGCYDLTVTPPYGPWTEIVRSWPDDRGLPPVPDALRGGEAMARLQSQAALFELAADLLATAGAVRPLVLVLEDLHWADQPSLELLRYLSRLVRGFRMMLVATYRDDEITRRHPLFQLLPVLAREPGTERIAVQRLDTEAIGDLVENRYQLRREDRERLVTYVQRITAGNPLFAGEVLRALEELRTLQPREEIWNLGDLTAIVVPELARQVIESRLVRLGEETHRMLQVAAVIGHDVPLDLWIAVSGETDDALAGALEQAADARIIAEINGRAAFAFTHALIRETLYEGAGMVRRRSLHRRAGEALAAGVHPDPDAVAHHFSQAGDERALEWLIRAAARANRSYAWLVAAERYEQAGSIVANNPDRQREYSSMLIGAAMMRRYTSPALSIRYLDDAARIGAEVGDPLLATLPNHLAGYYRFMTGQMRLGVDQMVAVGPQLDAIYRDGRMTVWEPPQIVDPAEWPVQQTIIQVTIDAAAAHPDGPISPNRGLTAERLADLGRFREARELAEPLSLVWPRDRFTPGSLEFASLARHGLPSIYTALASISHSMGDPQRALDALDVAVDAYKTTSHQFALGNCHEAALRTLIAYRTEDVERRRSITDAAVEAIAHASSVLPANAPVHLARLQLAIVEGEWEREIAGLLPWVQQPAHATLLSVGWQMAVAGVATLAMLLGRDAETRWAVDLMFPDGARSEPGNHHFLSALSVQRAAMQHALATGDGDTARAWLECYERWLAWSGAIFGQVDGHLSWARYQCLLGDLTTAEEQARAALAKASDPRQPLGLIAAHRLLGELAMQRGDDDTAREHLRDALGLAERCDAPFEIALTQTALAARCLATVEPDAASALLTAARATCERLGAVPQLQRIVALEAQLP